MEKFTEITSVAAPLPLINIDTDMIIPKQFLKTIKRTGLGVNLFDEMRYDTQGNEIADFVLNQEAYRKANIIVAGDNFGCGSSREHAPWSLLDFGIKAIIAPSFADIFYNNCFKNGILPVHLPQDQVDILMEAAQAGTDISVNLADQEVRSGNHVFAFEVDAERKHRISNGLDDISLTLLKEDKISTFETSDEQQKPWLYA